MDGYRFNQISNKMSYGSYGSAGGYPAAGGYSTSAGSAAGGYSTGGAAAGAYAAGGYGSAPPTYGTSGYASAGAAAGGYSGAGAQSGWSAYQNPPAAPVGGAPGGGATGSRLLAMAMGGGSSMGTGFGGSRGGGLGAARPAAGSTFDMKKYAAYGAKRGAPGGARGGRGGGGFMGEKRPRTENKPREGREEAPPLFIDNKFNYWNLPSKAKVLLVSNIPHDIAFPESVYNLFSFYGDVARVKILRKNTGSALVEFDTATFACIARDHLDGTPVQGRSLSITFSRFDRVRMPEEAGLPHDNRTKDFTGPQYKMMRRYQSETLKQNNMRKIIKPTPILHINNIPAEKCANDIKDYLNSFNLNVTNCLGIAVKTKAKAGKENAPRMFCYMEFATVDEALLGMAQLGNKSGMRISFAKDGIEYIKRNCTEKKLVMLANDQIPPASFPDAE